MLIILLLSLFVSSVQAYTIRMVEGKYMCQEMMRHCALSLRVYFLPAHLYLYYLYLHSHEGHGVHRVAAAHRRLLLGHRYKATSPNGRFTEGSKLINNQKLIDIQAVGKNLFYFFGNSPQHATIVHIHFGMSGGNLVALFCTSDVTFSSHEICM